jgi:ATP-binding cassette subfamily B protein
VYPVARDDDLPAALPSLWLSLRLGYRAEPRLLPVTFAMTVAAVLPDVLLLVALSALSAGVVAGDRGGIVGACVLIAALSVLIWLFSVLSTRLTELFGNRVTVDLEARVAALQASAAGLEHHERPEYLDRLSVLRNQVFALNHLYRSIFSTVAAAVRVGVTLALLGTAHPLMLLLGLFALPPVVLSGRSAERVRRTQERVAPQQRRARHAFLLATSADAGKEVRVAGIGDMLIQRHNEARRQWYRAMARQRLTGAAAQSAAWVLFSVAYVSALALEAFVIHAPLGTVVLVLATGGRLSQYLGELVSEANFLRGDWLGASQRLAWLERYAGGPAETGEIDPPARMRSGIRLEKVSFRYPGATRDSLHEVDLFLPAGSIVAVVGENGAGKTTLVKLLCRFYQPDSGQVTIDGVPLTDLDLKRWRARITGVFQDFFNFEWVVRRSVGAGDLTRIDDSGAVRAALIQTGGQDLLERRLPRGLDTQLGSSWPGGTDLSTGQWQRIAVARGAMRQDALLRVLDEPSASLDAQAEHDLFESYSAIAGGSGNAVTLLVSHRFSTVRRADHIVVLDGASVAEQGTHEELMAAGGKYAELYSLQERSYQ